MATLTRPTASADRSELVARSGPFKAPLGAGSGFSVSGGAETIDRLSGVDRLTGPNPDVRSSGAPPRRGVVVCGDREISRSPSPPRRAEPTRQAVAAFAPPRRRTSQKTP